MSIRHSTRYQLQCNLAEDFLDLLLPPSYPFPVETGYPRTASMETLVKDRISSLDLPEQKLLRIESLSGESSTDNFPEKAADWCVLFTYDVLEGFGHKVASSLGNSAFEGLKQLATLWGSYLARETERFFNRRRFFTVVADFIFDLFVGVFCQIPAKELGEAIRESATPAYVRAGETIRYELALFHNDQARMSQSMSILMASDAELEREIANMFSGCSTKQLGRGMQRIVDEALSELRKIFTSKMFRSEFDSKLPAALLTAFRDLSWYIGYRLNQNLRHTPQRTTRLLEAIDHHKEIKAAMEQYRYRHGWHGDRNKAVRLGWQSVAPKYFGLKGEVERIESDIQQERLIGVSDGLRDYSDKNPAIRAISDGFSGGLAAYLHLAAENEKNDYLKRQITEGNRALTKAKHASDLRSVNEEEDKISDDEILSLEKEKHHPSKNTVLEQLEKQESYTTWYNSLTERERMVVDLKLAGHIEERIAQQMGISQQRVSELLRQARKKWLKINR
jgi:RNA polymerase sigma factor (sigma-70 family)